jgi:hypothetical protein
MNNSPDKKKGNEMNYLIKMGTAYLCLVLLFGSGLRAGEQSGRLSPGMHSDLVEVVPAPYEKALRNPLMGFTTRGIHDHPWATLTHTYIRWNEIENDESDGIDKIRQVIDKKWGDVASRNIKVIPRVYLYWSGNQKYWPADMTPDDYTSEQFQQRVVRLIERLGLLWDTDPRVAFVEMGLFGKWGEQEQPFATKEIQKLVADAFAKAFKNKLVSVRRNWEIFQSQPFGEYWDSWAHLDQMWDHGNRIARLNAEEGRYLKNYIGGEVAYDWGSAKIQPGPSPTASVAMEIHRNFIINTIRWLHCTQLRWIGDYDRSNKEAQAGADLIQQAFGYRYILEKVAFSPSITKENLRVVLHVKNVGSAPFYYDWPLEVSLLNPDDRSVVWKQTFDGANIRDWLPGEGWTAPEWVQNKPKTNWVDKGTPGWTTPPKTYTVSGDFKLSIPAGKYILALAVLDPAGHLPSLRFATSQYFKGGRHPVGIVAVNQGNGGPLPEDMFFDDPAADDSLHYIP